MAYQDALERSSINFCNEHLNGKTKSNQAPENESGHYSKRNLQQLSEDSLSGRKHLDSLPSNRVLHLTFGLESNSLLLYCRHRAARPS